MDPKLDCARQATIHLSRPLERELLEDKDVHEPRCVTAYFAQSKYKTRTKELNGETGLPTQLAESEAESENLAFCFSVIILGVPTVLQELYQACSTVSLMAQRIMLVILSPFC